MRITFLNSILCIVILYFLASSCKEECRDPYKGLTKKQTELLDSIIVALKSNKPSKDFEWYQSDTTATHSSVVEQLLRSLLKIRKLEPIDPKVAYQMYRDYDVKNETLQTTYAARLKDGKETRSILVPADSLKAFADALVYYQEEKKAKTGARIVFATYPFMSMSADYKESGRSTIFVVGTMDTTSNNSKFEWKTQKDMTLLGLNLGWNVRNHGELCPDYCDASNTIYH